MAINCKEVCESHPQSYYVYFIHSCRLLKLLPIYKDLRKSSKHRVLLSSLQVLPALDKDKTHIANKPIMSNPATYAIKLSRNQTLSSQHISNVTPKHEHTQVPSIAEDEQEGGEREGGDTGPAPSPAAATETVTTPPPTIMAQRWRDGDEGGLYNANWHQWKGWQEMRF